jgi:hypothetical protein
VVCSALCDLVPEAWLARLAAALRVPFYAALNVDGRDRVWPPHPADGLVAGAFRRDQARDKGFGGVALGPRAAEAIARVFGTRGWQVTGRASDWVLHSRGHPDWPQLRGQAPAFLTQLVLGHAAAAERQARAPARRRAVDAWGAARLRQVEERTLAARIGHRDLLALPPPKRR